MTGESLTCSMTVFTFVLISLTAAVFSPPESVASVTQVTVAETQTVWIVVSVATWGMIFTRDERDESASRP